MVLTAETVIENYSRYRLKPFQEIISDILKGFTDLEQLRGQAVLELGPGHRPELMRYLGEQLDCRMDAVGCEMDWPFSRHRRFLKEQVIKSDFGDFFRSNRKQKYRLIYSRHVFEQHSYHPILLMLHPSFRQHIFKNRMLNPDSSLPGGVPNHLETLKMAIMRLEAGGVFVAQVAHRRWSVLSKENLRKLPAKEISRRPLSPDGEIITLRKS